VTVIHDAPGVAVHLQLALVATVAVTCVAHMQGCSDRGVTVYRQVSLGPVESEPQLAVRAAQSSSTPTRQPAIAFMEPSRGTRHPGQNGRDLKLLPG
jgi:hypothetical protein